jgi:E3 ubiquitin-protein ligase RNF13
MLLGLDDKVAKKTLKANEVKKFPTTVVSEPTDDVCTVCFGEQEIGQTVMILPCNHRYHVPCIETWLTKSGTTCPLCGISLQN